MPPLIIMSIEEARLIALGSETAVLGRPSKMPGYAFSLPAKYCQRGAWLAQDPTSICAHCFGRSAFYETRDYVVEAHLRHLRCLGDPLWVPAMTKLIDFHKEPDGAQTYFRWQDSGDLQGVWHLKNIVEVCHQTPDVKHWLPTHEPEMVQQYLTLVESQIARPTPSNLCIRISADYIGKPPQIYPGLERLPTSTSHLGHGKRFAVKVPGQAVPFECDSYTRSKNGKQHRVGECGTCRACWEPKVKNVSYPVHGWKYGKYQLPLFQEG